jgi:hypothetical protein
MPKEKNTRHEKKKGLNHAELVEKYEAGAQPLEEMLDKLLSTPNPKAPPKRNKRP